MTQLCRLAHSRRPRSDCLRRLHPQRRRGHPIASYPVAQPRGSSRSRFRRRLQQQQLTLHRQLRRWPTVGLRRASLPLRQSYRCRKSPLRLCRAAPRLPNRYRRDDLLRQIRMSPRDSRYRLPDLGAMQPRQLAAAGPGRRVPVAPRAQWPQLCWWWWCPYWCRRARWTPFQPGLASRGRRRKRPCLRSGLRSWRCSTARRRRWCNQRAQPRPAARHRLMSSQNGCWTLIAGLSGAGVSSA